MAAVALAHGCSTQSEKRVPAPSGTALSPTRGTAGSSAPRTPPAQPTASTSTAPDDAPVRLADTGIYSDLDSQVTVAFPSWLKEGPVDVGAVEGAPARWHMVSGRAIAMAPARAAPTVMLRGWGKSDADGDGIPDQIDILIGGKKTVIAAAPYKETYRVLPYPNGDVPREEGVCTDVVVRALRNAGYDLQKLVHDDAVQRPGAYPGISKLDTSIDHRRVRNLLSYFDRYWEKLPTDPADKSSPWLPGDVVLLDTMRDPQPDHLGILSDHVGASGLPLVINSWTTGYHTAEMDLLAFVRVTHHFRVPAGPVLAAPGSSGLPGILQRSGLSVPPGHRQVVLVTVPTWSSSRGELRKYSLDGSAWRQDGTPVPVRIGKAGLGTGRGLLQGKWPSSKREGDLRSPAGGFLIGEALSTKPLLGLKWPVRVVDGKDRWVDDPESPVYNTLQRARPDAPWKSAEDVSLYGLAVVIRHNDAPVAPGAGSAIFLHGWEDFSRGTVGCTGIGASELRKLLEWLEPAAQPLIVQVAGWVWE